MAAMRASTPHRAPVPKKSWGKQPTPRHCLPSKGEGDFSYHVGAFPSCPPMFAGGGGGGGELPWRSKCSIWVSSTCKPAAQPTARQTSLHPGPWPAQRCPDIFPATPARPSSLGFYWVLAGCVGRLLAQGIAPGMSNLSSMLRTALASSPSALVLVFKVLVEGIALFCFLFLFCLGWVLFCCCCWYI